jgi:tRNA (mo5U34)-methyltransferase
MSTEKIRQDIDEIAAAQHAELLAGSWWHSIDLGDGQVTPGVHSLEELKENYTRFHLPHDLTGKRLLDIGCWDGFYSFEAERHGALTVAVDCWRPENFFKAREALKSRVEFHELSVYEVTKEKLGSFDVVFFLGVLYHLRHPLLALEQVCQVTRDCAIIETHVIDNVFPTDHPIMEFYEFDELGGQYDNWWGPNLECLTQLTRSAGFARSEVLRREPTRATIKAYRRWDDKPVVASSSLRIREILNAVTINHHFPRRGRRAFLMILAEALPAQARRWEVRIEVGGFGVHPNYVGPSGDTRYAGLTQINVPVPPGLDVGKTNVCVWHEGHLSNEYEIELVEGGEW